MKRELHSEGKSGKYRFSLAKMTTQIYNNIVPTQSAAGIMKQNAYEIIFKTLKHESSTKQYYFYRVFSLQ